jgi:hypothetical protein
MNKEVKQSKIVQQSVINWVSEVEQERQLLFEAIAYLHDDVQSQSLDINKIQSDTRRLRDFLLYKIEHAEEERIHFSASIVTNEDYDGNDEGNSSDVQIDVGISGPSSGNSSDRRKKKNLAYPVDVSERGVYLMLAKADEMRNNLEQSESEAASHIGKIVAERESLKSDRDLLLLQLDAVLNDLSTGNETISKLRSVLDETCAISKKAVADLKLEQERSVEKERGLNEAYEHAADQIFQLTNELNRASDELSMSLKANSCLKNRLIGVEAVMASERAERENDKDTLRAALKGIDVLAEQMNDIKVKEFDHMKASEAFASLAKDLKDLKLDNVILEEMIRRLRRDLDQANVDKAELQSRIQKLHGEVDGQEEEEEEEQDKKKDSEEFITLTATSINLQSQLTAATQAAAAAESTTNDRIALYQQEIEIFAEKMLAERSLSEQNDVTISKLREEAKEQMLKYEKMEEKLRQILATTTPEHSAEHFAERSSESFATSELMRTLHANRILSDELVRCRNLLKIEQEKCAALEKVPSVLKSKQIADTIEASRNTLFLAAAQVDSVCLQAQEGEQRLLLAEAQVASLKEALSAAILSRESEAVMKTELQLQLDVLKGSRNNAGITAPPCTLFTDDNIVLLLEELERMTQLKDIAETKVASLSLVDSGTRLLETMQLMSFDSLPGSPSLYSGLHGIRGPRPIPVLAPIQESDPKLNVFADFYYPEVDCDIGGSPSPTTSPPASTSPRGRRERAPPCTVLLSDPIAYTRHKDSYNTVDNINIVRSMVAHTDEQDYEAQRDQEDRDSDSYDDYRAPSMRFKTGYTSPSLKSDIRNSMKKIPGVRTHTHTHQQDSGPLKISPSWKR